LDNDLSITGEDPFCIKSYLQTKRQYTFVINALINIIPPPIFWTIEIILAFICNKKKDNKIILQKHDKILFMNYEVKK
jgi:hypothetical protein